MIMVSKRVMIKQKQSLGRENLETAGSAFMQTQKTIFMLLPFFSNSKNHSVVEVESPGRYVKD